MIEVVSCPFSDSVVCEPIFQIRRKVFVEEQNVLEAEEFDEYESTAIHYLGLINGIPAGTARWRVTKNGIKLERFAVLKELRYKGVAAAILKRVLTDTIPAGVPIYLHAQLTAQVFYEKHGFTKYGDIFEECNILHYKMFFNR
ncbi:MAG: GNAT family N-acetyltransferase [Bacteroidota bacterium]|jgi:predicted GNAT family N-acyltransferase